MFAFLAVNDNAFKYQPYAVRHNEQPVSGGYILGAPGYHGCCLISLYFQGYPRFSRVGYGQRPGHNIVMGHCNRYVLDCFFVSLRFKVYVE